MYTRHSPSQAKGRHADARNDDKDQSKGKVPIIAGTVVDVRHIDIHSQVHYVRRDGQNDAENIKPVEAQTFRYPIRLIFTLQPLRFTTPTIQRGDISSSSSPCDVFCFSLLFLSSRFLQLGS